jgi:hypothetical protein
MMTTLVLNADTSQMPIGQLLEQANREAIEVQDSDGKVVAVVLSATEHEAVVYAEALRDVAEHRDELKASLSHRGGITTAELLRKAAGAAQAAEQP